jgi:hypothetical protein
MRVAGFPNVERITYQISLATFLAGLVEEKQQSESKQGER